jgi:tetratricopeptide (TPR) repeat protein
MIDSLIVGIGLVFVPMIISRFMMEKALSKLDGEMKLKLLDAFSRQRKFGMLIGLSVFLAYLFFLKFLPQYTNKIVLFFGISFVFYFIIRNVINYRIIKFLNVPPAYCKTFKLNIVIISCGFLSFGIQQFYLINSSDEDSTYKAWVHAAKGYDDMVKKDYKNAIMEFCVAIQMDSTEASYYTNRGTSYYYYGAKDVAKKDWNKAAQLGDSMAANYLRLPEKY